MWTSMFKYNDNEEMSSYFLIYNLPGQEKMES